jgi:hypothetical protein
MYVFSIGILFFGYEINQIFNDTDIHSYSYDALTTLAGTFTIDQQINASLIFGDFIAALTLLFGIVTGNTISSAITTIPFVDTTIELLVQIIFSLSSVFLWIYIVANRSI